MGASQTSVVKALATGATGAAAGSILGTEASMRGILNGRVRGFAPTKLRIDLNFNLTLYLCHSDAPRNNVSLPAALIACKRPLITPFRSDLVAELIETESLSIWLD